ncbi:hypothetical protein C4K40_4554 [Pseudomonas sp. CMR5c]|nr:hypothetical protein C4K40_4554 [Pseudomonas sp. CMR5c]
MHESPSCILHFAGCGGAGRMVALIIVTIGPARKFNADPGP